MRQTCWRLTVMGSAAALLMFLGGCDHFEKEHGVGGDHGDEHADGRADKSTGGEDEEQEHDDHGTGDAPASLDELPDDVNAVQHEMLLLDEAMRTTLTLIANDQLDDIPPQIHQVHSARQITVEAIEAGEYKPPKNGDRMEDFEALDDAFHDDLKALLKASKEDDLRAATDAYGELVQGCTSCHTEFRY